MKYGLYDVTYDPDATGVAGGYNLKSLTEWERHSVCCASVLLALAAQRDDADDISLRALEKLAARYSPTHALELAQATRTELAKAHAWIGAVQADRAKAREDEVAASPGHESPPDRQQEFDRSIQAQHEPIDDVSLASASIVRQLEKIGQTGKELATEVREGSRKRMREYLAGKKHVSHALDAWIPRDNGEVPILMAVVESLWHDKIKRQRPLRRAGYHGHARIPKHAGGVFGWACGAPAVAIDGQRYGITPNPELCIYGPRTLPLLPDGLNTKKSHKASLPVDFDSDGTPEGQLALAMVDPCQVAVTPAGTKIALQILTDPHVMVNAGVATITAKDLASEIHKAQKYQRRMLAPTATGVTSLRSLMVYMPNGTRMQVFDVCDAPNPDKVKEETRFGLAITRNFEAAVRQLYLGKGSGSWNGTFMLDVTGAMTIPMNQPEMLRLHVWASAQANAAYRFGSGCYEPDRHHYLSLDEIAARVNAYDQDIAEALAAHGKLGRESGWKQRKRSEQRSKLRGYLGKLAEMKLWELQAAGKRFRLAPTRAYIEAWKKIREGCLKQD